MRHLLAILGITAAFLIVGAALWGFPGGYALLALLPGVVIGGTGAHILGVVKGDHEVRPGVIVLGFVMGSVGGFAALAVFAAVNAPAAQLVEHSAVIGAPPETTWAAVREPEQRSRWNALTRDVEAIGRGGAVQVGNRYRATMEVDGSPVPTEQVITGLEAERRLAWRVEFPPGTQLQGFSEELSLEPSDVDTRVTYRVRYDVPTVLGRVFNNLRLRQVFDEAAVASLEQLGKLLADR